MTLLRPTRCIRSARALAAAAVALLLAILLPWSAAGATVVPCPLDTRHFVVEPVCHALGVPLDHARPGRGRIGVMALVVRATGPKPHGPPVFFFPGGPGGRMIQGAWLSRLLSDPDQAGLLFRDRDWVFIDQRGAGVSTPVLGCGPTDLSDAAVGSQAEVKALASCAAMWSHTTDLRQFRNESVARDAELVRRALGYGKVHVAGGSYGASYALTYLRLFPSRVEAVVIDSGAYPETNSDEETPRWVGRSLARLLRACAADAACSRDFPDLERRVPDLARRLGKTPLEHAGRALTDEDLARLIFDQLYSEAGLAELPRMLDRIERGDAAFFASLLPGGSGYAQAQTMSVLCQDEIPFQSTERMQAKAGDDPVAQALARRIARFWSICEAWPAGPRRPWSNQPVEAPHPALLLAGGHDPCCPPDYAHAAMRTLPSAQVVVFENATHLVMRSRRCALAIVAAFLARPDQPVDSACAAADPPVRFAPRGSDNP